MIIIVIGIKCPIYKNILDLYHNRSFWLSSLFKCDIFHLLIIRVQWNELGLHVSSSAHLGRYPVRL